MSITPAVTLHPTCRIPDANAHDHPMAGLLMNFLHTAFNSIPYVYTDMNRFMTRDDIDTLVEEWLPYIQPHALKVLSELTPNALEVTGLVINPQDLTDMLYSVLEHIIWVQVACVNGVVNEIFLDPLLAALSMWLDDGPTPGDLAVLWSDLALALVDEAGSNS